MRRSTASRACSISAGGRLARCPRLRSRWPAGRIGSERASRGADAASGDFASAPTSGPARRLFARCSCTRTRRRDAAQGAAGALL